MQCLNAIPSHLKKPYEGIFSPHNNLTDFRMICTLDTL